MSRTPRGRCHWYPKRPNSPDSHIAAPTYSPAWSCQTLPELQPTSRHVASLSASVPTGVAAEPDQNGSQEGLFLNVRKSVLSQLPWIKYTPKLPDPHRMMTAA